MKPGGDGTHLTTNILGIGFGTKDNARKETQERFVKIAS